MGLFFMVMAGIFVLEFLVGLLFIQPIPLIALTAIMFVVCSYLSRK